jgi:uncharacterized protein (UPF0548 family)
MWSLRKPTEGELAEFLKHQAKASFTYAEVGLTASEERWPCGFDHDRNRILLGKGADIFQRARCALFNWRHFPSAWTMIVPADVPIAPGNTIAVLIRALGVWWWNSARIVYTIDETGLTPRFGFANGTLPAHAERGEEQFLVEMDAQQNVWYSIRSFSRPRLWAARLAYPVVRLLQRRFVRDSFVAIAGARSTV